MPNTKKDLGTGLDERYRVTAVINAASILQAFSRERHRINADVIAAEINLSPALTRRTLNTLCHWGLMRRVDTEKNTYELGLAWLQLADLRRNQFDIREAALPVMRRMRDAVNETVILSVRVGYKRINIDYMESTKTIRRITQPGLEAPLHVGAAGRALICSFTADQLRDYVSGFASDGPASNLPQLEPLAKETGKIRQRGYGIAIAEITRETAAVAAPVFDYTGNVVAALTISCPKDRFKADLKDACIEQAVHGARELSKILGHHRAGASVREQR